MERFNTLAAEEAWRLRAILWKEDGSPVRMVVVPEELPAIWAELTEGERERVQLLTRWTCG